MRKLPKLSLPYFSRLITLLEDFIGYSGYLCYEQENCIILTPKKMARNRGGSRTAATSKMERFVIIINGYQPLTITTKRSILDVAAVPDPPLRNIHNTLSIRPLYVDDCS